MSAPARAPKRGLTAARLTPEQVRQIRTARLDRKVGPSIKSMARDFGVSPCTVKAARLRHTYRWVA